MDTKQKQTSKTVRKADIVAIATYHSMRAAYSAPEIEAKIHAVIEGLPDTFDYNKLQAELYEKVVSKLSGKLGGQAIFDARYIESFKIRLKKFNAGKDWMQL